MSDAKKKRIKQFSRTFFRRKVVIFGLTILLLLVLAAIFAGVLTPYSPYKTSLRESLKDPSAAHLLGTDALGRDVLTRLLYGARISLLVGLAVLGLGGTAGTLIGMIAGYFGGAVDTVIMRFTDAHMSIPPMIMTMAICAALGGGMGPIIFSMAFCYMPTYIRLMRGQVLSVRKSDYVMASQGIGNGSFGTMIRHVLPNCISPLIVQATMNLGRAILTEASLSFLGVGISQPLASWGSMVSAGREHLFTHPVMSIAPGVCIMLVVLSFNLVGDGLRDALDPRLRGVK